MGKSCTTDVSAESKEFYHIHGLQVLKSSVELDTKSPDLPHLQNFGLVGFFLC